MAIETIGGSQRILNQNATDAWAGSSKIESLMDTHWENFETHGLKSDEKNLSFGQLLSQSLGQVNQLQVQADDAIQKLVTGKSKNIHETMLAVEKADIAFKAMNQVRHKVIDAYQEIMRMQI